MALQLPPFPSSLSLVALFVILAALLAPRRYRHVLLHRLGVTRPGPSAPADASSEKPTSSGISVNMHDFPPSRRGALSQFRHLLPDSFHTLDGKELKDAACTTAHNCVPIDVPSHQVPGNMRTTTGLSMAEIRALGDFPDYAALSGVPDPEPHTRLDIDRAVSRPYRPMRWKYYQTMSLSKLDPDWWLELDSTYTARMQERKALLARHGETIMQYSEGSELACKELMEMALSFLTIRYPQYFTLSPSKTHFHNKILGITTQLSPPTQHPLHTLFDHVPEDFALMQRDHRTGHYVLRAGFIVSAVGWNLGEKFNKPLHEIHEPVPHYAAKMSASMTRFFARLPTDRPIQRASWDICPGRMHFVPPNDPAMATRAAGQADPPRALADLSLRVDWQTLRRLPLSGTVAFNFKARFTPVPRLRREPYVPALLARVLRDGDAQISQYKMHEHVARVAVGREDGVPERVEALPDVLDAWAREQVERGVVEEGWEPRTLDEFPFFPGWEQMWRDEQGF